MPKMYRLKHNSILKVSAKKVISDSLPLNSVKVKSQK